MRAFVPKRARARATRLQALIVGCFVLAAGCSLGRSASGLPMHLTLLDGKAFLTHGSKTSTVTKDAAVGAGDRVVVPRGSLAQLTLAEGRVFELSSFARSKDAVTRVVSATEIEVVRGQVCGDVTGPVVVGTDTVRSSAIRGAFRVDKSLSTRVASYAGPLKLETAGDELSISQYGQATVAGGLLPRKQKPMDLAASDRCDKRYLQDAIDLDTRLANFARGLEAQLGPSTGLDFFRSTAPIGLSVDFLTPLLDQRRSDVLIGLSMAIAARSAPSPISYRFDQIFALWTEGASWGLIAHEYHVSDQDLLSLLLDAIQKAGLKFIGGFAGPGIIRASPSPAGSGASPTPTPSPSISISPSPSRSAPCVPGTPACVPTPIYTVLPSNGQGLVDDVFGLLPSP